MISAKESLVPDDVLRPTVIGFAPMIDQVTPAPFPTTEFGSPLYVYDEATLRADARRVRNAAAAAGLEVLYATKANGNGALLRIIREEGLGANAGSLGEVLAAKKAGVPADDVFFCGNGITADEWQAVRTAGVHITVDSLSQLETWISRFGAGPNAGPIGLRLNLDLGAGFHDHVVTAGPESKFGIPEVDLPKALKLVKENDIVVDVVHQHIGSGILDYPAWLRGMETLLAVVPKFEHLRAVNFGGGLGVSYRPKDPQLLLDAWSYDVRKRLDDVRRHREKKRLAPLTFRIEPGRLVVARCGRLLVTVTSRVRGPNVTKIGVDSGFGHLLRPMVYDAWHEVRNVSHPDGPIERYTVVGNLCDNGDVLAVNRSLPQVSVGDVLAFEDVGAYGFAMASNYNLRPRPAEALVNGDDMRIIRQRERIEDLI